MEGDFTHNSDDPAGRYSRVLMQQGRVQLDADWNEQQAIQTRALRAALSDLIGGHGGPDDTDAGPGFAIGVKGQQLVIGDGVYYVDGIRCAATGMQTMALPRLPEDADAFLVFLDVWERHVNAIEDPRIREVALLGPDTATRAEVVWKVRLMRCSGVTPETRPQDAVKKADRLLEVLRRPRRRLAAHALTVNSSDDPCKLSPLSQYRGRENQLYRVEIHAAGAALSSSTGKDVLADTLFTFKWSRDNGSVVFPIVGIATPSPATTRTALAGDMQIEVVVQLGHLGRDERLGLAAGDIVEFVDDHVTLGMLELGDGMLVENGADPGRRGPLGLVVAPIDRDAMTVRVLVSAEDTALLKEWTLHPYLRRWDHARATKTRLLHGAIPVSTSDLTTRQWIPLEEGIEIRFEVPKLPAELRAGDYWQIPARVATGGVLWPETRRGTSEEQVPDFVPPHGPDHHYAPLAFIFPRATPDDKKVAGLRRGFKLTITIK